MGGFWNNTYHSSSGIAQDTFCRQPTELIIRKSFTLGTYSRLGVCKLNFHYFSTHFQ